MTASNITLQKKILKVKVIGLFDPERPSWASNNSVFIADHPSTHVGYLTKHFYGNSVSVGDEIPSWTYDTISNHGFDSSSWNTQTSRTSNIMPPNSGPIPNTQGVYSGQEALLDKELSKYKISDIDVLRFWPAGRPNSYGGMPPYNLYNSSTDTRSVVDGATVISQGESDNSNNSPHTYFWIDTWLNDCKYLPLTVPSYMHNSGEPNSDYELYPKIPELGMWVSGGKDLGIKEWSWQSHSTTTKYGRFCGAWHQNLSATQKRNTTQLTTYPLGIDSEPSEEYTYQKSCGTNGTPGVAPTTNEQGLTIVAGSTDTDTAAQSNFLLDKMWGTSYYTGGFLIENRGLAYHLRNAVKWNNLGDAPSIGDIKDTFLTELEGEEGNIYDGNVGVIPPLMTFAGGGGTWSSDLKFISPYNKYLDWDEEIEKLDQYYSNDSRVLRCEILEGEKRGSAITVRKPGHLIVTDRTSERVCPEYKEGCVLLVMNNDHGNYIDLNIDARQKINYSSKGTLEPYFDYFPDDYIPFETNFLLPPDQKIPAYSFNCSKYTYASEIKTDTEGSKGEKGQKGESFGTSEKGIKGEPYTDSADKGEKGEGGSNGEDGDKGQKGQNGQVGPSPQGDKGTGIITGTSTNWGGVTSSASNYTLGNHHTIGVHLGTDAANPDSNWATTVNFSRQLFGVAVEDVKSSPGCNYSGTYIWASDFVD